MRNLLEKLATAILLIAVFLLADGCCRKTGNAPGDSGHSGQQAQQTQQTEAGKRPDGTIAAAERPVELLEKIGLNYSIDGSGVAKKSGAAVNNSFFEKQYLQGVDLMEKGEYTKAIELFDELVKRYPNTEEASIAELCIAELFFRNKSNDRALQAYERIVANYPQSHAAENARAGIAYLKNFEKYEQEYVSPDVESRKRRGY